MKNQILKGVASLAVIFMANGAFALSAEGVPDTLTIDRPDPIEKGTGVDKDRLQSDLRPGRHCQAKPSGIKGVRRQGTRLLDNCQ